MKTKKILSLVLALIMVLTMVPAFAETITENLTVDEIDGLRAAKTVCPICGKADGDLIKAAVMGEWKHGWWCHGPSTHAIAGGPEAAGCTREVLEPAEYADINLEKDVAAKCGEAGQIKWTCSVCSGKTFEYTLTALTHDMGEFTRAANNTAVSGILVKSENNGNENANDPRLGTLVAEVTKEATKTTEGLIAYTRTCENNCGLVELWLDVIPATGFVGTHTCIDGTYTKVQVADSTLTDEEKATSATCSKDGKIKYALYCDYVEGTTGAACGKFIEYIFETTKAYNHTLINEAYNAVKYVVGEKMTIAQAQDIVAFINDYTGSNPNKGHLRADLKFADGTIAGAPTCAKAVDLVVTCDECVAGKKTEVLRINLPATGIHEFQFKDGSFNIVGNLKDPTCTENGLKVVKCINCDYTKEEVIAAEGHDHIPAVLNAKGEVIAYWDKTAEETYGDDIEAWAKTKMDGCKAYTLVKICRNTITVTTNNAITTTFCNDTEIIKEFAASWNHEITVENYKNLIAADRFTCLVDASEQKNCTNEAYVVVQCKGCDFTKKLVLKEAGHVWKATEEGIVKTAATCQKEGEMIVGCEYCSATTIKPIAKKDHVKAYHTCEATCTKAGTLTTSCSVCGETLKTESIPAGHVFTTATRTNMVQVNGKWVVEDCTKVATEKGDCVRCHLANQTNTYAANTAHTKAEKLVKGENYYFAGDFDATCRKEGQITYDCAKCTKTFVEYTPVLAHFSDATKIVDKKVDGKVVVLKAATCTAEGIKLVECGIAGCNETKEAPIAKAEHTFKYENNKLVCKVCGATEDMVDGHDYKVDTKNVNMTSTSTSGNGKVTTKDGSLIENHTKLYARINFGYKLDNGEAVAYVTCVPVENGSFRMASPTAPYGATLTNVTVMITTAENAQDMLIADVPNCGVTVLR